MKRPAVPNWCRWVFHFGMKVALIVFMSTPAVLRPRIRMPPEANIASWPAAKRALICELELSASAGVGVAFC